MGAVAVGLLLHVCLAALAGAWDTPSDIVEKQERLFNFSTRKAKRMVHTDRSCEVELTSMLKSGSTWTEIIVLMMSEKACSNDPSCSFMKTHARGKAAHNRTVGFHLITDHEREDTEWDMCNATIHFNSATKHTFLGSSFYREGVRESKSFFGLISKHCVAKNISLTGDECLDAMVKAAPDKMRVHLRHTKWLTVACLRDPRAVAVSECHWMGRGVTGKKPCAETTDNFKTLVYATAFLYNYWTHVLPSRSHLVIYERLLANPVKEYRSLAHFLGVSELLSDDEVNDIVEQTTATALAKKEAEGKLLGKTKVKKFNGLGDIKRTKKVRFCVARTAMVLALPSQRHRCLSCCRMKIMLAIKG